LGDKGRATNSVRYVAPRLPNAGKLIATLGISEHLKMFSAAGSRFALHRRWRPITTAPPPPALWKLFADGATGGYAMFAGTIARVSSFTGVAGQMTLTFGSGITTVRLDIDGNGVAEYQVKINGDVTGDYGGWLL
jgi:hypothetical protein